MTANFATDTSGELRFQLTYFHATHVVSLERTSQGFIVRGPAADQTDVLIDRPPHDERKSKIGGLLDIGANIEETQRSESLSLILRDSAEASVEFDALPWDMVYPSYDALMIDDIHIFRERQSHEWDHVMFGYRHETGRSVFSFNTSGWIKNFEITWREGGFQIGESFQRRAMDWPELHDPPTGGMYAKAIEVGDQFSSDLASDLTLTLTNETQRWHVVVVPTWLAGSQS